MGTSLAQPSRSTPPPPTRKRNYLATGEAPGATNVGNTSLAYAPSNIPATNPIGYSGTSNPQGAAVNQRAYVTGEGDALQNQYANQYNQQQGAPPVNTVAGTANYLNAVEDPLAQGQGGYNASESSQIE